MRRTSDDDHGYDHDPGHDLDLDHRQATGEGSSQATGDGHLQATGDGSDVGVEVARLTAFARGTVQGVGFRWWVRARALELGLVGHAANLDDGRVEIVAEGDRAACTTLLRLVSEQPSTTGRPGRVVSVGHRWSAVRGTAEGFVER